MVTSPISKFQGAYASLVASSATFDGTVWLRIAALMAALSSHDSATAASRLRLAAAELKRKAQWLDPLGSQFRYVIAGALVIRDITVDDFLSEVVRGRQRLVAAGLGGGGRAGVVAILVLHLLANGDVRPEQITATHALYIQLRRHHPWLTNRNDLPVCALLTAQSCIDSPERVGERVEACFRALVNRHGYRGSLLQISAAILSFATGSPESSADRFLVLMKHCKEKSVMPSNDDRFYPGLALLALLNEEPARIVSLVDGHLDNIWETTNEHHNAINFDIAVGLAFSELISTHHASPHVVLQLPVTLVLAAAPLD